MYTGGGGGACTHRTVLPGRHTGRHTGGVLYLPPGSLGGSLRSITLLSLGSQGSSLRSITLLLLGSLGGSLRSVHLSLCTPKVYHHPAYLPMYTQVYHRRHASHPKGNRGNSAQTAPTLGRTEVTLRRQLPILRKKEENVAKTASHPKEERRRDEAQTAPS